MSESTPQTGNSVLLDTNIVSAALDEEVAVLEQLKGKTILIPAAVVGELYYGANRSTRRESNIQRIEAFLEGCAILAIDQLTGFEYAKIKYQLKVKGRPIPENDIWIAAAAIQHELVLITRDAHFKEIAGLAHVT